MVIDESQNGKRSRPLSFGNVPRQIPQSPPPKIDPTRKRSNLDNRSNSRQGREKDQVRSSDRKDVSAIIKDFLSKDLNMDPIIERIKEIGGIGRETKPIGQAANLRRPKSDQRTRTAPKLVGPPYQKKLGKSITLEELDEAESEVEMLLQDIEILEKQLIQKPYSPPAVRNGSKLQEKSPTVLRILLGKGKKIDIRHPFRSLKGSRDPKWYIPIVFAIMAPLVYVFVAIKVVFDAPIGSIVPVYLNPVHLFYALLAILTITSIANFIKRYRLKHSGTSISPIWNREVGKD
jgi:hypothetical protein